MPVHMVQTGAYSDLNILLDRDANLSRHGSPPAL